MPIDRALLAAQGYIELDMPAEALRELDELPPEERGLQQVLQVRLFVLMRHAPLGRGPWRSATRCARRTRPKRPATFTARSVCTNSGARARPRSCSSAVPAALLREATYYYNLGCYDAVLGNIEPAVHALEISFKMDDKFREIAKYDPDLKSVVGMLS